MSTNRFDQAIATGWASSRAERAIARRCRSMSRTSAANYRKVIVALYVTVESEGWCDGVLNLASNVQIGEAAGLKGKAVAKYLRFAEADKVTRTFRDGLVCRVIVLLDHKDARKRVWNLECQSGEASRNTVRVGA